MGARCDKTSLIPLRPRLFAVLISAMLGACAAPAPQPPAPGETHVVAPQFVPPQSGTSVQRTFKVVPQGTRPRPCISVEGTDKAATLLLSRRLLEELKAGSPNAPKEAYDKRMAGVHAARAGLLLDLVSGEYDGFGCSRTRTPVSDQVAYLLGVLLSSGQAIVIENKTGRPVDHILVMYSGNRESGHVRFTLPEDRQAKTILSYRAWGPEPEVTGASASRR